MRMFTITIQRMHSTAKSNSRPYPIKCVMSFRAERPFARKVPRLPEMYSRITSFRATPKGWLCLTEPLKGRSVGQKIVLLGRLIVGRAAAGI